ncbi:DNA-processing protein DprA [Agilicoccus flavus]|uniref:DNA-processing protein DprA n=1 Tax=Agilicoccus flavus TaxID=2775968 RepID=UPI001CF618EF|nr:DNA-processing protein DprA [Agilicoccus flavus]
MNLRPTPATLPFDLGGPGSPAPDRPPTLPVQLPVEVPVELPVELGIRGTDHQRDDVSVESTSRPPAGPSEPAAPRASPQARAARAAWSRLAEPGDAVAHRLITALGPIGALEALRTRGESALDRFRPRLANLDVERDLAIAERVGARIVVPGDPDWPTGLDDLPRPPYCLWVRGPRAAPVDGVAVVGARVCTHYGQTLAADLAAGLAGRGHTVVSGAAFGIDAAAHRGALAAPGPTVTVLACGIERPYPAAHRELIERIAAEGLVATEVPPGSAPTKSRLLQRNRLIATMTSATLVVEAGLRSGSRHTAGVAAEHHRVVLATPGPVTSRASAGCHEMIRAGLAALVTDVDEILEMIGPVGVDLAAPRRGPDRLGDDLAPEDRRVFEALARRPRPVVHLARVAGLGEREVTSALGRLSLRGLAHRDGADWRR